MTVIFEHDFNTRSYPLSRIEWVGPERKDGHGGTYRTVKVHGEDGFSVQNSLADRLLTTATQLIPAQPGTFLLWSFSKEGEPAFGRNPVVAWALCLDGKMRPVTAQGVNDGEWSTAADTYIEMPDGSVQGGDEFHEPAFYDNAPAYAVGEAEKRKAARESDPA